MKSPEQLFQETFPEWARELAIQKVIAHQWARETGGPMRNDVSAEAERRVNEILQTERPDR